MNLAIAIAVVALACGCTKPPTAAATAPAPTPRRAEPPVAAREELDPPTVTYESGSIDSSRFPVVASDGSVVLMAHQDGDGGRGNPNLTLRLVDRKDVHVKTLVVLTPNDYDRLIDRPRIVEQRFALANKWIEKLHAEKQFVPLSLDMAAGDACSCVEIYEEARIVWKRDKLTVTAGHTLLAALDTPPSWHQRSGIRDRCANPAFLASGGIDRARRIAVVAIAFEGSDLCWAPGTVDHVIAW